VPLSSAGVAAVVGTFVGISRRHAGGENGCDSQELGVTIDSFGVDNEQYGVGEGNSVEGLVFSTGVPSKVTMVMMTFSAFVTDFLVLLHKASTLDWKETN